MLEWLLAIAVLAIAGIRYRLWTSLGTEKPVERHSAMPSKYGSPDGW